VEWREGEEDGAEQKTERIAMVFVLAMNSDQSLRLSY